MKYKVLYFALLVFFTSCNDFLEEESNDLLIPETIENLSEFLYGEVICENRLENYLAYLHILSDNTQHGIKKLPNNRDKTINYYGYFTFNDDPEITKNGSIQKDKAWDILYHQIFTCNIILDQIKKIESESAEAKTLLAETHFMRALKYFMLVNLYGEPYENEEQAKSALGIPLNDKTEIEDILWERSSLMDCYNFIESDLKKSIEYFKNGFNTETPFRPNLKAAYLLASRFYLYKKDYQNCLDLTNTVINMKPGVIGKTEKMPSYHYFFDKKNQAILFSFGKLDGDDYWRNSPYASDNGYRTNTDFLSLLNNDHRYDAFLAYFAYIPWKVGIKQANMYGKCIRMEEAYLNRAEARYFLNPDKYNEALDDINYLRSHRVKKDFTNLVAINEEEAFNYIKRERRLELCFENHRWFDLRRWGDQDIHHIYKTETGDEEFVCKAKSKNFTLPIPLHIRTQNPKIERLH